MSDQLLPRVTSHAKLRFLQRAEVVDISPDIAWETGTPVEVEHYDYQHARYHAFFDVIFLARDGVLTTVLKAAYTDFTEVAE